MNRFVALMSVILAIAVAGPTVASAAMAWESTARDVWNIIAPTEEVAREELYPVPPTATGDPLRGRWSRLAPGDTLSFAVRGSGQLRVETRPVFATDARGRRYRLGVETAPDTWRRIVRQSDFATEVTWGPALAVWRIGEVDRWQTDLLVGSEYIRVTLREKRSAPVFVRVLARGDVERLIGMAEPEVETTASAARWRFGLAAQAGAGHDDNPYLTPTDVADTTAVADAWYATVDLAAGVDLREGLPFDLDLDYRFQTEIYDDDILGETRHRLRLRETWRDVALGPLGTASRLRLEQQLRTRDRTFFGRGDNEEFETGSDLEPGQILGLGDRFDWRELAATAELRTPIGDSWQTDLELLWLRRDYTEDYDDEPDIYALDQDRYGLDLAITRTLGEDWQAILAGGVQWWRYDEKFARDAQGLEQPDVTTRLRRSPLSLALEHGPRHGWQLNAELGSLWTVDERAGYWDRQTWFALAEIGWRDEAGWSLEGRLRHSDTSYDRATLDHEDGGALRTKDSWRARLSGAWEFRRDTELVMRLDWTDLENNSRTFAYERTTVELGVRGEF